MTLKLHFLFLSLFVLSQVTAENIQKRTLLGFNNPNKAVARIGVPYTAKESIALAKIVTKVLAKNNVLQYKNFGFYMSNKNMQDLYVNLYRNRKICYIKDIIDAVTYQLPPSICFQNTILKMILDIALLPNKLYIHKLTKVFLNRCYANDLGSFCNPYGEESVELLKNNQYEKFINNIIETIKSKSMCRRLIS